MYTFLLSLLNWAGFNGLFFQMYLPYIDFFLKPVKGQISSQIHCYFFLFILVSLFCFWVLSNHFYFPENSSSCVCSLMCTSLLSLICADNDVLVPPQEWWRLSGHKCRTTVLLSTALILSFCWREQSCYCDY